MELTAKENKPNTYDETPYSSYPFPESRPDYLRTIGQLFGMNPPEVKTARVLELGCGAGGNIIPHATKYPKAKFVGVDLSKVQIDAGDVHIKKMGLKNIELKHMSIADVNPDFGEFDYIISHGVISWVPDFVRDKIFEVSSKNLSPQGVAYISYNTLPGWNTVRTIRDMMLFHTESFTDPKEKVSQARSLLNFVNEGLADRTEPYALMFKEEAKMLSNQNDYYLRHDHLEEENKQFYFNEFVAEAGKHDLQYLSECSLGSMYVNNLPAEIAEKLSGIKNMVRSEQYIDFIINRRFRRTLLCHKNVTLNRSINKSIAREFAISANVMIEKPPGDVDIEDDEPMTFYFDKKKELSISTVSSPMKAIMLTLAENQKNPLEFDEIVRQADLKLKTDQKATIDQILENNAVELLLKSLVTFSLETGNHRKVKLDKPKLSRIAFYQITQMSSTWVTNTRHEYVPVGYFEQVAGQHMNGKNTVPQILEKLLAAAEREEFQISSKERTITEREELETKLRTGLNYTIQNFLKLALLI